MLAAGFSNNVTAQQKGEGSTRSWAVDAQMGAMSDIAGLEQLRLRMPIGKQEILGAEGSFVVADSVEQSA